MCADSPPTAGALGVPSPPRALSESGWGFRDSGQKGLSSPPWISPSTSTQSSTIKSHKVSPLAFRLSENALDQWVCWGPSQKPPSLVAVHPLVDPKLHTQFWTCWTNPGLKHKVGGAGSTSRAPKTSLCCSPATSSLTETEFTKVGGFQSVKSGAGERHKKILDPSPSARVRQEFFASEDDYQAE